MTLGDLEARVCEIFGEVAPLPDRETMRGILTGLDYRVEGDEVVAARSGSIVAPRQEFDAPAAIVRPERTPEQVVRDMLQDAARTRGSAPTKLRRAMRLPLRQIVSTTS